MNSDNIDDIVKELNYKQYLCGMTIICNHLKKNDSRLQEMVQNPSQYLKEYSQSEEYILELEKDIRSLNNKIFHFYIEKDEIPKSLVKDTYKFGYIDKYNQFIEVPDEEKIRIKEKKNVFSRANVLFIKNKKRSR